MVHSQSGGDLFEYNDGLWPILISIGHIVDLLAPAPNNSTISVVSLLEGETKILYNIPENSTSVSINVSDISKGLYIVSYSVDSEIIDQKRINL